MGAQRFYLSNGQFALIIVQWEYIFKIC